MSDKTPVEAEAAGETTATIEDKNLGVKFEIPTSPSDWPAGAVVAIDRGNTPLALYHLMPSREFAKVESRPLRDLAPLAEQIFAAMGFGSAGESSASSD